MVVFFFGLLTACKKNNVSPETMVNDPIDTSNGMVDFDGMFINGPYGTVTGSASVVMEGDVYKLALQNFTTSNGPDLHVYLSKEIQPINFIDLGKIKSTNGNQVYSIPGKPDFTVYKYALIHCQQFNHLFGSAALK